MTDFNELTDIQPEIQSEIQSHTAWASVRRRRHSPWFWFALVGGSVALHGLAIHWVRAATLQALLRAPAETPVPIDWVELPAEATADSNLPKPQPAPAEPQAGKTAAKSSPKPQSATDSSVGAAAADAIQATISTNTSNPVAVAPASGAVDTSPQPQDSGPTSSAKPTKPTEAQASAPVEQPLQSAPAESMPFESVSSSPTAPIPQPSPAQSTVPPLASPSIITQQIDVPVPDVSGTMPLPTPLQQERADAITDQVMIPTQLTASLTTDPLPAADRSELDETAQPKTEVKTFSSNPRISPCVVTPEAVQFLGKTVAMQVATDETGQVVHTVTHESSKSQAYDELATCLVKHWSFEPAIAGGEPVADDQLLVRITIERSANSG